MGLFGKSDTNPKSLRTVSQVQADPSVAEGYVLVPDEQQNYYEARGYTFVEDLAGDMCLMKRGE